MNNRMNLMRTVAGVMSAVFMMTSASMVAFAAEPETDEQAVAVTVEENDNSEQISALKTELEQLKAEVDRTVTEGNHAFMM